MKYTCDACGVQGEGYTPMDPPGFWTIVEGVGRFCPRCSSLFKSLARDIVAQIRDPKYVVAKDYHDELVYTRMRNGEIEEVSREEAEPIPDSRNPYRYNEGFVWADGQVLSEVEAHLT